MRRRDLKLSSGVKARACSALRRERSPDLLKNGFVRWLLVELLAREIKQRRGKQNEHAQAEEIVGGPGAEKFGTKRKEIGTPRQTQHGSKPAWNVRGNLGILK